METQKVTSNLMASKAVVIIMLLMVSAIQLPAQKIWETRKGCFRAQGNLAPGYLFSQKFLAAYVTGDMDLFLDDRTAFTGAIWISFATNRKNAPGITANHALFSGINYHFLKPGRFDPFIGVTPGLGLVQGAFKNNEGVLTKSKFTPVPLIAASVGCNYYVGWFFHFFIKVQGVAGQAFGNMPEPVRVDELKVTAGLGWNIRVWKPKRKDFWKQRAKDS